MSGLVPKLSLAKTPMVKKDLKKSDAAPTDKSDKGSRKRRDATPRKGEQENKEIGKLSSEVATFETRLSKFFHLLRLYVEAVNEGRTGGDRIEVSYLTDNPDRLEDVYASKQLLTKEKVVELVSKPKVAAFQTVKLRDLDWDKSIMLLSWIHAQGVDKTVQAMQQMKSNQRGTQKRLAACKLGSQAKQAPVKSSPQVRADAARLSADIQMTETRLSKLFHLLRVYVDTLNMKKPDERVEVSYLSDNPDGIKDLYGSQQLLSNSTVLELISRDASEFEAFRKVKSGDLQWDSSIMLISWIHAQGADKTVQAMRKMKEIQRGSQKKLGINRSAPQILQTPVKPPGQTKGASGSRKQQKDNKTPGSGAFAWSSFQNSPHPKTLPTPKFLKAGSGGDDVPLGEEVVGKLGVPPPPQPSPTYRNRVMNILKQGEGYYEKPRNTIAPSPIRGGRTTSLSTRSGSSAGQEIGTRTEGQTTADSLHLDATNHLRQMLGVSQY